MNPYLITQVHTYTNTQRHRQTSEEKKCAQVHKYSNRKENKYIGIHAHKHKIQHTKVHD